MKGPIALNSDIHGIRLRNPTNVFIQLMLPEMKLGVSVGWVANVQEGEEVEGAICIQKTMNHLHLSSCLAGWDMAPSRIVLTPCHVLL